MPAADVRAAARLYATGGNGAIYYGLGVTEHSQGSTMVMGIANLAMATGNIGREGVGVNPLRGQNNVQGSCDMGSFPHEFPGYRHVRDDAVRGSFEQAWGVKLQSEPGLRIPNMFEAALDGEFMGLYIEGEDIGQSDPNTQHVTAALTAMECIVVQDLFLNETAKFAHVFLPGSTFLEKDGTFTNAERRISRVRTVMRPEERLRRLGDHAVAVERDGLSDELRASVRNHGRDRAPDADVHRRELRQDRRTRQHPVAVQRRASGRHADHARRRIRARQGQVPAHRIRADHEKVNAKYPLILTTGRILSQYNVGAQTRRTANVVWHSEDRLEIHPHDAEERGIKEGDWVGIASRAGDTVLRALISERMQPGVVYTTFHFPGSGANVITTENSDWATNCPEYKVTAVQVTRVSQPSEWQKRFEAFSRQQQDLLDHAIASENEAVRRAAPCRRGAARSRASPRRRGGARCRCDRRGNSDRFRLQRAAACGDDGDAGGSRRFRARLFAERGDHRRVRRIRGVEIVPALAGIELRISVPEARAAVLDERVRQLTGRTGCGLCGAQTLDAAVRHPPPVAEPASIDTAALQRALGRTADAADDQCRDRRDACGRLGIAPTARVELVREDVGRHNALDKLIGAMQRRDVDVHARLSSSSPAVPATRWS